MARSTAAMSPAAFTTFGELLRYLRRRRRLTQIELAIAVGYSTAQISRLEQNQRLPNPSTLHALFVSALGIEDEPELVARLLQLAQAARGELAADQLDQPTPPPALAAAPLPSGTITFLFTDIEGSTQHWEQHPQAMLAALQRHEVILRQTIAAHRGVVFKTVGDAVCAAFASAPDALAAALAGQRALVAEAWDATGLPPRQPLRVRMALYTGAAEVREGDYFGPPLNRAARLLGAAHGGQVLLSRASAELVADGLPAGVILHDLGTYQLTGLRRPEQIFQLVSPDLPSAFPPLRTLAPAATNSPAPAIPLLTTKLYVPPPRPHLVPRPHLIARLQAGMTCKLTLLAAPTGFGKTTLLAEWLTARTEGRGLRAESASLSPQSSALSTRVAWLSLDDGDNDPANFLRYLIAALQTLAPTVGSTALALLQTSQPPGPEMLLRVLLNDLAAFREEVLLALDDYHLITTPAIHAALAFLLDHLPPQLHLIVASREDPPLPLARLRAQGHLLELRAAELRFTPAETATFLTGIMRLPLNTAEVAALETRTEGWIAGLQLAALAMRDRSDLVGFISAFTGSNRFVGDYLVAEVFVRQPPHLQAFLLQTSILDRMCGALCDAVMGVGEWGHRAGDAAPDSSPRPVIPERSAYSQLLLEQLERSNLFTIALDDERRWFRYHHLFGEALRQRLLSGATAAAIASLHQRASAWYEGQGLVVEAVQHGLAAQDWERAARVIEEQGLQLILSGQVDTVLGWLNAIPTDFLQLRPILIVHYAAGLMFTYQVDAAEARVQDAERCLQHDTPDDLARLVRGRVALCRGIIRCLVGDLAQALSFLQQALALLPETTANATLGIMSGRARAATAVYVAATAYQLTGDVTATSERRAAEAIAPIRTTGYVTETLHSYTSLAALQMLQGRLRTAAATYTEVERLVPGQDALQALIGSPAYYIGMGDLLREWNDLDAAEGYLARGMELVQGTLATEAEVIARGYIALARVQQAGGNAEAALATLDAFMQVARERQLFPLLIERAAAMRARLQLLQGDLPAAIRWTEGSGLSPDGEISFSSEIAFLTLARVRVAAGQTEAVVPLLDQLLADAEEKARMHSAIEIRALQALAYDALNDRPRALTALEQALALAEPEGYIRIFVDEGAPVAALLRELRAHGMMQAYIVKLLDAFPDFRLKADGNDPIYRRLTK